MRSKTGGPDATWRTSSGTIDSLNLSEFTERFTQVARLAREMGPVKLPPFNCHC
jgi:hypothetical protein